MVDAIKFGASISTSGRYALQGRQALAGLRAWAAATHAEGGAKLPGWERAAPVEIIHYDDRGAAAQAVANVEKLIRDDNVHILLGPYSSDLTGAVVPVARKYGKLLWNHGGAVDAIHRRGCRAVGILTPTSRYLTGLIDLARSIDPNAKRVAVLYRRGSGFGSLAARGARRVAREARFTVATVSYSSARDDLPNLVAKLRRFEVDLILSASSFQDDCALARGLITAGVTAKAFGFVAAAMREFGRALGPGAEGFLGPSQWEPGLRPRVDFGPSPSAVAKSIRTMGAAPDYPAAQAYAACLIALRCLEGAGSAKDEALWQAACSLDCTTFFGRFKMDPLTGLQVVHEMVWVQWQHGRKAVVWPPTLAKAKSVYPAG